MMKFSVRLIESGYFDKVLGWDGSQSNLNPKKIYSNHMATVLHYLYGESWQNNFLIEEAKVL